MKRGIEPGNLEKITSSYLAGGIREDKSRIHDVVFDPEDKRIDALLTLDEYAADTNGEFHLSDITSSCFVAQMCIAYICLDLDMTKEQVGEVWQTNYSVKNQKPILTPENISGWAKLTKKTDRTNTTGKMYYTMDFDVGEGSFYGKFGACVQLNKS